MRIQSLWSSRRNPLVHCVATLTRTLSSEELGEMERFPQFSVSGEQVTFSCRPEETEVSKQTLAGALADSAAVFRSRGQRRGLRAIR